LSLSGKKILRMRGSLPPAFGKKGSSGFFPENVIDDKEALSG